MKTWLVVLAVAVIVSGVAMADYASDMNVAIQSLPVSPDLAGMGGLNICIPTTVGVNAAQNGLIIESNFAGSVYGESYWIDFKKGPRLRINAGNVSVRLGPGSLKLNYYQVTSTSTGSRSIVYPGEFEAESVEISYGLKLTDRLAVGASVFPLSTSKVSSSLGPFTIGEGEGKSQGAGSLGVFYRLTKKINLAGTWNIASEQDTEKQLWFAATKSTMLTNSFRGGVSVQPWKGGTFGAEILHMRIDRPGQTDSATKLFYGAEQYFSKHFCVRAGCLNERLTAGIGIVLGKKDNIWIDAAYLDRPVAMEKYWGESRAWMLSLCVAW